MYGDILAGTLDPSSCQAHLALMIESVTTHAGEPSDPPCAALSGTESIRRVYTSFKPTSDLTSLHGNGWLSTVLQCGPWYGRTRAAALTARGCADDSSGRSRR